MNSIAERGPDVLLSKLLIDGPQTGSSDFCRGSAGEDGREMMRERMMVIEELVGSRKIVIQTEEVAHVLAHEIFTFRKKIC